MVFNVVCPQAPPLALQSKLSDTLPTGTNSPNVPEKHTRVLFLNRRHTGRSVYCHSPEIVTRGLRGWREARAEATLPSVRVHCEQLDVLRVPVQACC